LREKHNLVSSQPYNAATFLAVNETFDSGRKKMALKKYSLHTCIISVYGLEALIWIQREKS
jgi:hypothetical protein